MTNFAALPASDGSGESIRATVQSPGRSIGSSVIPVNAITNWPTGECIVTTGTLQADNTITNAQVFYGTASGTDVTINSFAPGYTDLGNSAGDVVVIKPTTEWANLVAAFIQDTTGHGTPQALTASGITASGGTTNIDSTLYKPYKFSAYMSTNQSASSNAWTLLNFDTKTFDTGTNFSTSTHLFTAPIAGFYFIVAGIVGLSISASQGIEMGINVGTFSSVPTYVGSYVGGASFNPNLQLNMSKFIQLSANQTVGVYANIGNANGFGSGNNFTYFDGFLVSAT